MTTFFFHCLFAAAFAQDISLEVPRSSPLVGPYLGRKPPGDTPVLFASGVIWTGREHGAAMFAPDGTDVMKWLDGKSKAGRKKLKVDVRELGV